MKLVRESIEFRRGGNPREALGIGAEVIIRDFFNSLPVLGEYDSYVGALIDRIENGIAYFNSSVDVQVNALYEFPKELRGIVVDGHLGLGMNPIKRLPDIVKVSKWLSLMWTAIETLPEDLQVKGSIDLSASEIKTVDTLKKVDGGLDLSNTKIKELPNNLEIKGFLRLDGTPISDLPQNLYVGGDIHIRKTPLRDKYIKGEVDLERPGITIGGTIYSESAI